FLSGAHDRARAAFCLHPPPFAMSKLCPNRVPSNSLEQSMTTTTGRRVWRWSPGMSVLLGALFASAASAQSLISGRVTDSRSDLPVAGATIEVEGTRLGATTDADGRYRIGNVTTGARTV